MAIAVAAHRQGVEAVDPVAGPHQRVDEQAAIDLDADHDLIGLLGVIGDQAVQLGEARHARPRSALAPSTAPASSITATSLWASAQSTPTKITMRLPSDRLTCSEPEKSAAT